MKIRLERIALKDTYTIGKLYIDDVYFSDTLEDKIRDLNKDGDLDDAGETKIYGETAIPYGTYKIILSYSNRFKRVLPEILGVKGFEGIRIHSLNQASESHGCIGVGKNTKPGWISESKETFNKLFGKIDAAVMNKEAITIEII